MRIAVSNIAWPDEAERAVAEVIVNRSLDAVEIAPTKTFPRPLETTEEERHGYSDFWRERGVDVVAFQSMLFSHPDLQLFGDTASRAAMIDVLERYIELAGQLGVGVLVFGSPKNRRVPDSMTTTEARDIAVPFFRRLGSTAAAHGTSFCIEPNPTRYGCNFVTEAIHGDELVRTVDEPGFGLHLDVAGMTLAGDDVVAAIERSHDILRHFHASAPDLGPLESDIVDHPAAAAALRRVGYRGIVSVEMRPVASGGEPAAVDAALELASRFYC